MDYGGGDKEMAGWDCACGCLAVRLARVGGPGLQPIGCTSALVCVIPAPLKSRYVTWGAIQVLYAFAFAFALIAAHSLGHPISLL